MQTVTLYVPTPSAAERLGIDPGSAIVGTEVVDGRIIVDYEGNRYDAEALRSYEGRVESAAGRHLTRYATSARMSLSTEDLIAVGEATRFPDYAIVITDVSERGALAAWLGAEPLPILNGSLEMRGRIAAKVVHKLSPHELMNAQLKAQQQGRTLTDVLVDTVLSQE